ncbi:MAG: efflux RND transporter periplasmic adaptor subunit [Bacteroidia bacterium]
MSNNQEAKGKGRKIKNNQMAIGNIRVELNRLFAIIRQGIANCQLLIASCYLPLAFCLLLLASCIKKNNQTDLAAADEYYTCSMDPQVIEYKAGNCPICHMKLIKVKKNNLKAGQIKLSAQQIKLANITFDTLRMEELAKEITLTGEVTVDQNLAEAISAKVQGRIEKLAVKNVGDHISKGQLLYEIYSEDLNAAQQEYIIATQQENISSADKNSTSQFIGAAKNKLILFGMNETQMNQLKTSKQVLQSVPVYSAADGFVSEISVAEGNYVAIGTTLFRLASLHSLWVEAQVYLPYLPYLKERTEANFSIPAASEKLFHGKVIFIDPQVQSPERFVLARFQITNPSQEIKPGMLANIALQTENKKALTLPIDAIIQDSKGANVWVRNNDGVFENKMITTGMQNSRQIEIIDGLMEGEVVVITGAYLLNSEYVFKKGANPMEGHQDMPGMKM